MILLVILTATGGRAVAFQMIGYFYPAVLCGTAMLCQGSRMTTGVFLVLLATMLAMRLPRLSGVMQRYVIAPNERYIFTEKEIANLARSIGSQPVSVEVKELLPDLLLLVELGRHHVDVRWSSEDWGYIVRYRGWPWPDTKAAKLKLQLSEERKPGHQFDLVQSNR